MLLVLGYFSPFVVFVSYKWETNINTPVMFTFHVMSNLNI